MISIRLKVAALYWALHSDVWYQTVLQEFCLNGLGKAMRLSLSNFILEHGKVRCLI
jgi:hypothetical protein